MHAFTWLAKRKETGTDGYTWEEGRKRSIQVCVIKKKKRGEKICIYLYRYAIFEEKTFLVYVLYLFVCKKQIDEEEEEEERCRGKIEMREREREREEREKKRKWFAVHRDLSANTFSPINDDYRKRIVPSSYPRFLERQRCARKHCDKMLSFCVIRKSSTSRIKIGPSWKVANSVI